MVALCVRPRHGLHPLTHRMPSLPFTPDWADALCAAIESDPAYREAGRSWKWPVALVLEATPDYGYPDDIGVQLALADGGCQSATVVPPDALTADFVLRGDYATWKLIATGALDAVSAVVAGKLSLTGSVMTLMQNAAAARALVACARTVETRFPDEE